jgi:hypothetical protein
MAGVVSTGHKTDIGEKRVFAVRETPSRGSEPEILTQLWVTFSTYVNFGSQAVFHVQSPRGIVRSETAGLSGLCPVAQASVGRDHGLGAAPAPGPKQPLNLPPRHALMPPRRGSPGILEDGGMNIETEEERQHAVAFTVAHLHRMHRAFRRGLEDLGLKVLNRHDSADPGGRSCNTYLVEEHGVKFCVTFRGAFEAVLAVDAKADHVRIDLGLESERYTEEKIEGIVEPLMKLLPAALEGLEPVAGRRSMSLLGGALEVSLGGPTSPEA